MLAILLFLYSTHVLASPQQELNEGDHLNPAILDGLLVKSRKLSDYQGKPLVIIVWASWCSHCREEMASFIKLKQRFQERDFNIIGISVDDDALSAQNFVKHSKLSFDNYIDKNVYLENMLGAHTIPLTVLVDSKGLILSKIYGSQKWDDNEHIHFIAKVLHLTPKQKS